MALRAEGLTIRYGTRTAIDRVDLELHAGESLALIGPNGSGKTTLLHAMAGLVEPASGTLVRDPGPVALVLQATDVDQSLPITVRDTVRMARYPTRGLLGRFTAADHAAVDAAMARLDVADLAGRQLHDLSGGQRQRALVAQGLAQEHDLLLLDEPVNGLDPPSRDLILSVVEDERAAGRMVVLSTHNLDDAGRCDRVLLLATRAVAFGPPQEVLREHHLRAAFGSGVARVGEELVMDDPHHVH